VTAGGTQQLPVLLLLRTVAAGGVMFLLKWDS